MSVNFETVKLKGHRNVTSGSLEEKNLTSKVGKPYTVIEISCKEGDKDQKFSIMKTAIDSNPLLLQQLKVYQGNPGQPFQFHVTDSDYGEKIVGVLPTHKEGALPPYERGKGKYPVSTKGASLQAAALLVAHGKADETHVARVLELLKYFETKLKESDAPANPVSTAPQGQVPAGVVNPFDKSPSA